MLTLVGQIKKGDQFVCDDGEVLWTAIKNARKSSTRHGFIQVAVRFGDGEEGHRMWPETTSLPLGPPTKLPVMNR
jgi:hypothetical protein